MKGRPGIGQRAEVLFLDEGAVAGFFVEEVVGWVVLDPEEIGRTLVVAFTEQGEGVFLVAELGVVGGEFDRRDVLGF